MSRTRARGAVASLAALSFACMSTSALAAEPAPDGGLSVVVLEVNVTGDMPDHVREDLSTRVRTELARTSATVASDDGARACGDAACAGQRATAANASHAVRTNITMDGPDYDLLVEIVGADGSVVATSSDSCEVCGTEELGGTVTELAIKARKQLDALDTAPPVFVVSTTPPGAVVMLDGEPIGETPLEVQVPPGEHDVVVAKEGFIKQRQRLGFVDGVREQLEISLEPLPEGFDDDPVDRRNRRLRIGGWTAVGVGVAGVATGAAFFATNGREIGSDCSGDNVDADGDCRYVWDTTPGAIAFTAAGGVALVTGAVLLAIGYKKRDQTSAKVRLQPTLGGAALKF